MKATGIVRRVDDLGRVVIPKEIRRIIGIREGDPLEVFTDNDSVTFKKYRVFDNFTDHIQRCCDTMYKTSGHVCIMTDRNSIVAVSGVSQVNHVGKPVSDELAKIINDNVVYSSKNLNNKIIPISQDDLPYYSQIIYPIRSEGEVIGTVILVSKNKNIMMDFTEQKIAETGAGFLERVIED